VTALAQRAGTALVHTTAKPLAESANRRDLGIFAGQSLAPHGAINASSSIDLKTRNQLIR
jgi:hypothetical protein